MEAPAGSEHSSKDRAGLQRVYSCIHVGARETHGTRDREVCATGKKKHIEGPEQGIS